MKRRAIPVLALLGFVVCFLSLAGTVQADMEEAQAIRAAIEAKGARWTVRESWVTRLTPDERRKLLGGRVFEAGTLETMDSMADSPELQAPVPDVIDWRNKDGYNWVTSVKNQAMCGSCVAFGAVAVLESLSRIEQRHPQLNVDLSEMHLFNCGGGSCDYGWYNSAACSYLTNTGAPDEACWPYQHFDAACANTCSDWGNRVVKVTDYGQISGIPACKSYVSVAPILAGMRIYSDFYHYGGGIYEHSWGEDEGGHSVSIVGYDATGETPYWIVKNSWGTSWGEDGFFRIKMGECHIETLSSYWMSRIPTVTGVVPEQGGYGAVIGVHGGALGFQRTGIVNGQDGFYRFITISSQNETMIATNYVSWADSRVDVVFGDLFVDQNGNYLRDDNEASLSASELPLGDYTIAVGTIWFHDDGSGAYDDGDEVFDMSLTNSEVFTLCQHISGMSPRQQEASVPGTAAVMDWLNDKLGYICPDCIQTVRYGRVKIFGQGFGPQRMSGDQVRIGDPRTLAPEALRYDTDGNPYTVEMVAGGVSLRVGVWGDDMVGVYLYPEPGEILRALFGPDLGIGLNWLDQWLGVWIVKDNGGAPVPSNVEPIRVLTPLPD